MNDFDLYLSRTNEIMGERSIFELRMHRASNRVSTIERNRCPIKCGIRTVIFGTSKRRCPQKH